MNIRLVPVLLAAAGLLLASCLPESKNPLSTPKNSAIDIRLEGVYVPRDKDSGDTSLSTMHFHYRAVRVDGSVRVTPRLEVLEVTHEMDSGLKTHSYQILVTHIGTQDYMSFQDLGKPGGHASTYSFARYEVGRNGTLYVYFMDSNVTAQAIRSGKLHGTVKKTNMEQDVQITDSTEHLAAFVAANDPVKLFGGKPMILYRLTR